MESVTVKHGNKHFTFSSDKIVISKKDKIIRTIFYNEIEVIIYNPKFGFGDLFCILTLLSTGQGGDYFPNAFWIKYYDGKSNLAKLVGIKVSNNDFEKIKNIVSVSIPIVIR